MPFRSPFAPGRHGRQPSFFTVPHEVDMNPVVSLRSRVVASPDQVSCDLDGETVILSLTDGIYYGLGPVGERIWQELQRECALETVRDTLLREYEVEPERCGRDLVALVSRLVQHDLVRVVDEAPAD